MAQITSSSPFPFLLLVRSLCMILRLLETPERAGKDFVLGFLLALSLVFGWFLFFGKIFLCGAHLSR